MRRPPVREWPAHVAAAGVAVVVELGLRTVTLPRLARALGTPLRLDDGGADGVTVQPAGGHRVRVRLEPWARRRLRATRRVMRHWPAGDTCLRRALVSGQRLRRMRPTLRVGVAKIDGEIRAHAWLEIDGVSLDPAGDTVYHSFEPMRGEPR